MSARAKLRSLLVCNLANLHLANKSCEADRIFQPLQGASYTALDEPSSSQRPTCDSNTEYTEPEENEQRNSARRSPRRLPLFAFDPRPSILHNLWCNSKFLSQFASLVLLASPSLLLLSTPFRDYHNHVNQSFAGPHLLFDSPSAQWR